MRMGAPPNSSQSWSTSGGLWRLSLSASAHTPAAHGNLTHMLFWKRDGRTRLSHICTYLLSPSHAHLTSVMLTLRQMGELKQERCRSLACIRWVSRLFINKGLLGVERQGHVLPALASSCLDKPRGIGSVLKNVATTTGSSLTEEFWAPGNLGGFHLKIILEHRFQMENNFPGCNNALCSVYVTSAVKQEDEWNYRSVIKSQLVVSDNAEHAWDTEHHSKLRSNDLYRPFSAILILKSERDLCSYLNLSWPEHLFGLHFHLYCIFVIGWTANI